jgi:rod shape-determining protein MreC
MENFFTRYKNPLVLMAFLVVQVIALATQVKRPDKSGGGTSEGPRLIRVWTVTAITPFEHALISTGHFFRNTWHNYVDLHNVRRQNRELQEEINRMRLEQARLRTDAEQSRRLQALLDFKERYVGPTVAAQVIGSSGSVQARVIYIDKGSRAGLKQDMAVITPDGIVGKVRDVYPFSSQVLLINDRESGAGVILESSRLQGVLRGKEMGELRVNDIMSDEKVEPGERVITSGGDRIYPKGLPVGTVTAVGPDPDASPFLAITLKPAADLDRLEDVLVVTKIAEEAPAAAGDESLHRAADILAQRLPTVPKKAEENSAPAAAGAQPPPKNNSVAAPDQRPDQAGPQRKPGGAGKTPDTNTKDTNTKAADVNTNGAEASPKASGVSPKPGQPANPNRPQPPAASPEKPPQ